MDFGRFSIYRRIFSNSSVDLPDTPFDNAILPNPDDKINAEENTEITQKSSYTDGKLLDLTNQVYADFRRVGERLDALDDKVCKADKETAVFAATATATMSCMQQSIAQLRALTKVIVPNASVCPGWGDATITPATTTTTTPTT